MALSINGRHSGSGHARGEKKVLLATSKVRVNAVGADPVRTVGCDLDQLLTQDGRTALQSEVNNGD